MRQAVSVISFPPMRLLRALAHLVLALALVGVAFVPARAVSLAPAAMPEHHSQHHDQAHGVDAGHDHASPAKDHADHKRDACETACCFVPSQLPPRALDANAIEFFTAVRYAEPAQSASGRTDAPDPGIPKAVV